MRVLNYLKPLLILEGLSKTLAPLLLYQVVQEHMLKRTNHSIPAFKMKKSIVGRMLIAVYVLVVLALSATAKAEVSVPLFEIRNQISN
jgi:hypothetical protein